LLCISSKIADTFSECMQMHVAPTLTLSVFQGCISTEK